MTARRSATGTRASAVPASSEKQRRFMGAELARKRAGERTRTGMSETQLKHYAAKRKKKRTVLSGKKS
jgi:hypothetical protein